MIPTELLYDEIEAESSMIIISIAVSEYRGGFDDLPNAVRDAELVIDSLTNKYKVDNVIRLHEDAFTLEAVENTFSGLRSSLGEKDSILIMYNGHGEIDRNNLLYWVPRYGQLNQTNSWYLATKIFAETQNLNVGNSAIIVNCCESGRMHNQEIPLYSLYTSKLESSRMLLTSGSISQDVYDSFNNSPNSPFAEALNKCLNENNEEKIPFLNLSSFVISQSYKNESQQRPVLSHWGGHQEGMFYFFLKRDEEQYWKDTQASDSIQGYEKYLTFFRKGKYREEAKTRYYELVRERANWLETLKCIEEKLNNFGAQDKLEDGKFINEFNLVTNLVNNELYKLTYEEKLEKVWSEIKNSTDINDFEKFEDDFPGNKYLVDSQGAKKKLKYHLDAKKNWKKAIKKQRSPEAHRDKLIAFMKDFERSIHANEANSMINDIEEYIDAEKTRDLNKLKKYCKKENSIYKDKAIKLLIVIEGEKRCQTLEEEFTTAMKNKEYYKIMQIKDEIESLGEYRRSNKLNSFYGLIKDFEQFMQEDFNNAIQSQSLVQLYNFIDDFKEGHLVEEAIEVVKNLEAEHYDSANILDTIENFELFVSEFAPFKDNKKLRLDLYEDAIQRLEGLKQDKLVYERASSNIFELESYIDKSEKCLLLGKYKEQAQEKIRLMKMGLERRKMYEQIVSSPTIELCKKFISNFSGNEDEIYQSVLNISAKLRREEKRDYRYTAIMNAKDTSIRLKMAKDFVSKYRDESDTEYVNKIEALVTDLLIEEKDAETFNLANATEKLADRLEALNEIAQNETSIFKEDANQVIEDLLEKIRIDQTKFDQAISCEDIEEKIRMLSIYLAREDCIKKEEAQALLDALIVEKRDIDDFNYTEIHDNNVEAWERFIAKSIQSERKDDAIKRRDQLMAQREEENSYELLKTSPSKLACYAYIEKYGGNGKFINEVEHILNQILNDEALIKTSNVERFERFMDKNFKNMGTKVFSIEVILLGLVILLLMLLIMMSN